MRSLVVIAIAVCLAACSGSSSSSSSSGSTTAATTAGSTSGSTTTSTTTTSAGSTSTTGTSASTSTTGSTGSTTTSGGSTGGFEDAQARCLQQATAACDHDQTCGTLAAADTSACIATFSCDDASTTSLADEQVDAGLADVNTVALSGCVSDVEGASCGETGSEAIHQSTNCATVSRGAGGQGDPCVAGSDCQVHFACVRQSTACGGTCQPWSTSGPCGLGSGAVAVGYYCGDDGGVIAQSTQGASCTEDKACSSPFVCVGPAGAKTCANVGTGVQGDGCAGTHGCAPGMVCLDSAGDAGFCWPRVADGESCNAVFSDGGINLTRDGGPRPVEALCLDQLFCNPSTVTCQQQAALGGACNPDAGNPHCLEGACLDNGSGPTCTFATAGTSCARNADCSSGSCFPVADGGAVCVDSCP